MKKYTIAIALILAVVSGIFLWQWDDLHTTNPGSLEALRSSFRWKAGHGGLVSAHRGGPEPGFPENCLATFEKQLSRGPVLIECDIRKSKDGRLLLMHDADVDRSTNGKGLVTALTWAELEALQLRDEQGRITDFHIPDFTSTLQWADDKALLTLDIKEGVSLAEVLQVVDATGTEDQVIIITYSLEEALRAHEEAPDYLLSVGISSVEELGRYLDAGIPASHMLAFTGLTAPGAPLLNALHREGIMAMSGTFRTIDVLPKSDSRVDSYINLFEKGLDIIATDRPAEALRASEKMDAPDSLAIAQ